MFGYAKSLGNVNGNSNDKEFVTLMIPVASGIVYNCHRVYGVGETLIDLDGEYEISIRHISRNPTKFAKLRLLGREMFVR